MKKSWLEEVNEAAPTTYKFASGKAENVAEVGIGLKELRRLIEHQEQYLGKVMAQQARVSTPAIVAQAQQELYALKNKEEQLLMLGVTEQDYPREVFLRDQQLFNKRVNKLVESMTTNVKQELLDCVGGMKAQGYELQRRLKAATPNSQSLIVSKEIESLIRKIEKVQGQVQELVL